jgi:hypothetical protein
MFSSGLLVATILGAAVITSNTASYVRLESNDSTIEAGERFSIAVYAYAHVPVNAVDIELQFDDDAVDILGVDTGQSVITLWTEDPRVEGSRVLLSGGTYRKGFLEEHLIATINLRAKETGQSTVSTSEVILLAGDGSGAPVATSEVIDSSLNLFVYDENTTPEGIGVDVNVNIITDLNNDGEVTLRDVSAFLGAWGSNERLYDFNGDGRMNFVDFSIILANVIF